MQQISLRLWLGDSKDLGLVDTALHNFSFRQSPRDDGECRANGSDGTGTTEQST